jgi:hypothetical protein
MRARLLTLFAVTGLLAASLSFGGSAGAAQPSSGTIVAKDIGTVQLAYTGTAPPGSGSVGSVCEDGVNADVFTLTLNGVSKRFYLTHTALLRAHIEWDPVLSPDAGGSDLALIVRQGGQDLNSSDGGTNEETVALPDPDGGKYQIVTCDFNNASPQDYKGDITFTTAHRQKLPRAAASGGMTWMPLVVADPQRNLGEPSLRIDKSGVIYHCGPFGSSRGADYASRSTDNGDTFRVLGTPPEGRIAPNGGGDCEISVAPKKNSEGNYTLSYAGLESLLNFSTGVSTDNGRSFQGTATNEGLPVVDRQWMDTVGTQEVYLFYNKVPEGGTVQRSTDGGLTYAPPSSFGNAAPSITRPGNLIADPLPSRNPAGTKNETIYLAYTNGNKVEVARSTDQAQTFKQFVVVHAKGEPDELFPTIAEDTAGNLYVAWVEAGTYNAYYSVSRDHGTTWGPKQLVNRRGAATNLMPWVTAGSPGRIAVGFYCSPVDGDPQTSAFHGPWNVCVNESLNALSPNPTFSQVHVAHHPTHWDSICTNGLGCDTSVPSGDRSLLDFFTLRTSPLDGRLMVVFTEANKRAREDSGLLGIDVFSKQKAGPSLFARVGTVPADPRPILRMSTSDPKGDSKFPISSFGAPPSPAYVKALDIRSLHLARTALPSGHPALQIKLQTRDLSDAGLQQALTQMQSQQLKFVVRWFSAYRPEFVVADWRPGQGFSFSRGHLFFNRTQDGTLEVYDGGVATPGHVDNKTGVITWTVPYTFMEDLDFSNNPKAKPELGDAHAGDRIFELAGWTFGRPNPQNGALDYYNQADSTPSFDVKLP